MSCNRRRLLCRRLAAVAGRHSRCRKRQKAASCAGSFHSPMAAVRGRSGRRRHPRSVWRAPAPYGRTRNRRCRPWQTRPSKTQSAALRRRAVASKPIVFVTADLILPPPNTAGSVNPLTKSTIQSAGRAPIPTAAPKVCARYRARSSFAIARLLLSTHWIAAAWRMLAIIDDRSMYSRAEDLSAAIRRISSSDFLRTAGSRSLMIC